MREPDPRSDAELLAATRHEPEALAVALAGIDRFDASRGSARSWLFGIMANQVGSALRRGRAESRARRLGMEPVALADDQRAWVQALADEQDAALVMRLLAELPECDRVLLPQRVIGGRDYAQLSADLGLAEPAVRKRVSRGLAVLRLRFHEGQAAR